MHTHNNSASNNLVGKILSSQNGLIFGFAAMLILMVLITLVGVNRMETAQRQLDHHTHTEMKKMALGAEMRAIARERTLILHRLLDLDDPFERDEREMQLYSYASKFAETRQKLLAMDLSKEERELLNIQGRQAGKAVPLLRQVITLARAERMAEAKKLFVEASMPAQNEIIETMQRLYEVQSISAHHAANMAKKELEETRLWMYLLSSGLVTLGIFIAFIVIKRNRQAELERENYLHEIQKANSELKAYSSELLLARDAAQQASKAKSQFLANMSHELRTPLNAIMGYSELLLEDAEASKDKNAYDSLSRILVSSKHLLYLINQVLDLSRVEAGKSEVHVETFRLKNMLDEVHQTIEPAVREAGNELSFEIDPQLDLMSSDAGIVRQILFNLLGNANKFTDHGKLSLIARRVTLHSRACVELRVVDNGIGLSPEQIERVFSPFEQADSSTTRRFGGVGLGLALSKHYCDLLHGTISINSSLGEGAEFIVTLPLAHAG